MDLGNGGRPDRSPIHLNAAQAAVLAWIVEGCPDGVYPDDSFAHRITARALKNRGLVQISGHGDSWRAVATPRGRVWPAQTAEDQLERELAERKVSISIGVPNADPGVESAMVARALRRAPSNAQPPGPIPVRQVEVQESHMRYKVVVTRVQVAERWIRATDEEAAACIIQEEFEKPYAYFGHWETIGSEVEIVEAEQATVIRPNLLDESGPMLLTIKDAADALGIQHRSLGELARRGDIACTRIGTRKYVSREALISFVKTNTAHGYSEP